MLFRSYVLLRAFRAAGRGRVNDGNRAGILRHIKETGSRLHQGFRGVAAGVAAARDRFLESCKRLGGAGVELEQTQRTAERTSVELEYANQHVGAIIKGLEQAQQQKQREQQQAKPSRGPRL